MPLAVPESGVTLCSEVDGEDTIAPEDVGAESCQASYGLIVRGGRDLVGLEEMHAGGGQFNDLSQIDADQLFHAGEAHRSVLQHVERGIVAVVSQYVAEGERMDDATERLGRFVKGPNRTSGQRLDGISNLTQRQSGEAGSAGGTQFHKDAGVDGARTVSSCTDKGAQRLAEAVAQFLGHILDGVVDGGSQRQRREVGVIYFCLGNLCHHRIALHVAMQVRLYLHALSGVFDVLVVKDLPLLRAMHAACNSARLGGFSCPFNRIYCSAMLACSLLMMR